MKETEVKGATIETRSEEIRGLEKWEWLWAAESTHDLRNDAPRPGEAAAEFSPLTWYPEEATATFRTESKYLKCYWAQKIAAPIWKLFHFRVNRDGGAGRVFE